MNQAEYDDLLKAARTVPYLRGAHLVNKAPRTLIYGYTCNRDTFHVYLDESGILHRVVYDSDGLLISHEDETASLRAENCVPDKRVYPEACDLEFCRMLKEADAHIPFTTFNDQREPSAWYGKRKEDLFVNDPHDQLGPVSVTIEDLGLSSLLLESSAKELESSVSAMLSETLGRVYRRVKYAKSDDLPKWLEALPRNVEWAIKASLESMGLSMPPEYKMSPEVADGLRDKVRALMLARLYPAA